MTKRNKAFWRRWLAKWRKEHPLPPAKPKPPKPKPKPKPKPPTAKPPTAKPKPIPPPSWTITGPILLTASDPDAALNPATGKPRAGVAAIGRIVVPGEAPLWRVDTCSGPGKVGWLAQVEGISQLPTAYALLADKPVSDSRAVIGTGNVSAERMLELGVNVFYMEANAQAGWEPYGNVSRLVFQGHQDGWPYVKISYGVYTPVSLADYATYVPQVWSVKENKFVPGTDPQGLEKDCAIFSAEGMGDTDSWATLATL